jgi:hypothetical protein
MEKHLHNPQSITSSSCQGLKVSDEARSISRTRLASPSKLATFLACPLRYVLETESNELRRIDIHPVTLLGTAVHKTTESMLGVNRPDGFGYPALVEEEFAKSALDKKNASPLTNWVIERFGLFGLISKRQIVEQSAFAKSLADRFVGGAVPSGGGHRPTAFGQITFGTEKWLESASLGLGGKVDLIIQEDDGSIRIIDFKTGKVLDDEGKPKQAYLLQLAAYGRIVTDMVDGVSVHLEILGKTDSWTGLFDDRMNELIDRTLHELATNLPMNVPFELESLSRLGGHCSLCSFRPGCTKYRKDLSERMLLGDFDYVEWPFDIVGTVASVERSGDLLTVRCKLLNGNIAKVSRIPSVMLPEEGIAPGQTFTAFGLACLETKRPGTFPCNFSLFNEESPRNSAFQSLLEVI